MRVAFVHDWLLGMRGGERVLEVLCEAFPEADIYTLFYKPENIRETINAHKIFSSFLNKLPSVEGYYRTLLPFFPLATRLLSKKIRAGNYDLVISVSHCAAKNVRLSKSSYHLCYCLTPMRYIWDKYEDYFSAHRFEKIIRLIAKDLRNWDKQFSKGVDEFVCISEFIKERIASVYNRDSTVIYPPVTTNWIRARESNEEGKGFLCANALVPYKNTKYVVEAFNQLGLPLTIVGKGPELENLKSIAKDNIRFIECLSDSDLAEIYRKSKALVFAAEEDFGMIPVEMQAAGRPVICYAKGGSLETVCKNTAVFFYELSAKSIAQAVLVFLEREKDISGEACILQASKFSKEVFLNCFLAHLSKRGFDCAPEVSEKKFVNYA